MNGSWSVARGVTRRAGWFTCFGLVAALCLIALIVIGGAARGPAASPPDDGFKVTTVFLVRHAEKAAEPKDDPPLLESGIVRSKELARILGDAGIRTIYTSQYLRTKQTAAPLAAQLGIVSTVVPLTMNTMNMGEVSQESIGGLAAKIYQKAGQNALVVGHSNTVPETIRALGGDVVPTIRPEDFDDLFVVTIYAEGKAKVAHLKY